MAASVAALVPWGVVEAMSQQLNAALNMRDIPARWRSLRTGRLPSPDGVPVRPDPAAAIKDVPLTWMEACGHFDPASLELTNACSARRTRLKQWSSSGHAAQYVDPLVMAGSAAGWKVQAMVRNGCPFTAAPPSDGTTVYRNCSEQNKATMQRILQLRPRLVVVSGMAPTGYRQALKWGWGARMNSSPDMSSS